MRGEIQKDRRRDDQNKGAFGDAERGTLWRIESGLNEGLNEGTMWRVGEGSRWVC